MARQEIEEIQQELQKTLQELVVEIKDKVKPEELAEIQHEFEELHELLERIKTGLVWIALYGKTSVGKSAITNSLIGKDVAKVGVQHDVTGTAYPHPYPPWMIVDVPGIMGKTINEKVAVEEAKKAHGIVFVLDGEPYQDELELFHLVNRTVDIPKIVFVNKWDTIQGKMPKSDVELVKSRIAEKMSAFIKSSDEIIYGSAQRYDSETDVMVRQSLDTLVDRMYADAGTLGTIVNILDPAHRADDLMGAIHNKVFEIRARAARKVIKGFALASMATSVVPAGSIASIPILISMVFIIFRILGREEDRATVRNVAIDLWKACVAELGAHFIASMVAEALLDVADFIPFGFAVGIVGDYVLLSAFKYRRTTILGEVAIEYIKNGCKWGPEGRRADIQRAKHRAETLYSSFRKNK